jgi:Xaa-Pro aminopeptidase
MKDELNSKIAKINQLLAEHDLDALLIQRVTNFAWLTCGGASYINTAEELGVASLLISPQGRYVITNNIEATRFKLEEGLGEQGWDFKVNQWYQPGEAVDELTKGLRLGTDGLYPRGENINPELIRLRADLLPIEQDRFRELSRGCAQAINATIHLIRPGMTEFEIAAALAHETQKLGILPIVNLIATDERIFAYRHPLPTTKRLERYAMLVLCGRKHGLVASVTRLVYFGALPEELQQKSHATASIDAKFIASTRPGSSLAEIFTKVQVKYAQVGYPDEWLLHHQGGPAGYAPREEIATPQADWIVKEGQVFAWNPSITGTKSEDTILVKGNGNEIMTEIPGWPEIKIDVEGQVISRPAILELT